LLRYFLAVAEELHFGRAAARLHIAQPSLSAQIQKLERGLGTPLFVRTSRHVELTVAGRAFLDEARVVLAAIEKAVERVRLAGAGLAGIVRLGYAPPASFETLPALLAAVADDSPNVTVVPSEHFSAEAPARLVAGEIDVGLVLHPERMNGIESEPLRVEPVAAVLSAGHSLAGARSIRLADLADETLLFPRELAPAYYDRIIGAFEHAAIHPRVSALRNPAASLARLVNVREVGLIPASFAFHLAEAQDGIVARDVVRPKILAEWSIVWSAGITSAAVARFLDSARRCAADSGWLPQRRRAQTAALGR
jgi:DNA-binding transcriptional LysR family regulator